MKKTTVWGVASIVVLVLANIGLQWSESEDGSAIGAAPSPQSTVGIGDLTVGVPLWLEQDIAVSQELHSSQSDKKNIFQMPQESVETKRNELQNIESLADASAVASPEVQAAHMPTPKVEVLAINYDGNKSSALLKLHGKTQIAFIGDIVFGQYSVNSITSETVFIDVVQE